MLRRAERAIVWFAINILSLWKCYRGRVMKILLEMGGHEF